MLKWGVLQFSSTPGAGRHLSCWVVIISPGFVTIRDWPVRRNRLLYQYSWCLSGVVVVRFVFWYDFQDREFGPVSRWGRPLVVWLPEVACWLWFVEQLQMKSFDRFGCQVGAWALAWVCRDMLCADNVFCFLRMWWALCTLNSRCVS